MREGRIRYHHFGEGEYAMPEMVIQQLLRRGRRGGASIGISRQSSHEGSRSPADWATCDRPRPTSAMGSSAGFASPDEPRARRAPCLRRALAPEPQPLGASRDLDDPRARRGPGRARRADRVPLPGPRCQPRHGTRARRGRPLRVPRAPRRAGTGRCARVRRRRPTAAARSPSSAPYQLIRQPGRSTSASSRSSSSTPGVEAYCFTFG